MRAMPFHLRSRLAATRLGPLSNLPERLRVLGRYEGPRLRSVVHWLRYSREDTNFTYDLTPLNREQLVWFVADVANADAAIVREFVTEIEQDRQLKDTIRQGVQSSARWQRSDEEARYGCRIGWYAFVRLLKPLLVVETGVDKGLGSCVIAAALLRNAKEGNPGRLIAVDIDPTAGELIREPYCSVVDLVFSDSHAALRQLDRPIDIFLHDSDHSPEHERGELDIVMEKVAPGGLVLSDNSHVTSAVSDFAAATSRRYLFFREQPADHWYPGGGIGAAFSGR
jgi:predicted O-methyltransferase YrrM